MIELGYNCPNPVSAGGAVRFTNLSNALLNLFVDSGSADPSYRQLAAHGAAGDNLLLAPNVIGDSWVVQAQGVPGIAVLHVAAVHRVAAPGPDCHVQVQGTFTN